MSPRRYDPLRQMTRLCEAIDRLYQDSFMSPGSMPTMAGKTALPLGVPEDEGA